MNNKRLYLTRNQLAAGSSPAPGANTQQAGV